MIKRILFFTALCFTTAFNLFAQDQAPLAEPGIFAEIETSKGLMIIKLDYENAPLTTINFVNLAENGFYSDLKFYKDIENYAVFSGDPLNDGTSSADYSFPMEKNINLLHNRSGILTMDGISGLSNGSRFFITRSADLVLDEKYTSFGYITEGEKVLKKIERNDIIKTIKITRTGSDALTFQTSEDEFNRLKNELLHNEMDKFKENNPEIALAVEKLGEGVQKTLTGIFYQVNLEGNGEKAEAGDLVSVHYTGMMLDGTVFDSSVTRGVPFDFEIGTQSVIAGWDETVLDMSIGEKRTVIIPPSLAYGDNQAGPIAPNTWLMFEVEFIEIK